MRVLSLESCIGDIFFFFLFSFFGFLPLSVFLVHILLILFGIRDADIHIVSYRTYTTLLHFIVHHYSNVNVC